MVAIQDTVARQVDQQMPRLEKMAQPLEDAARHISPLVFMAFGLDCCFFATAMTLARKHHLATMFASWSAFSVGAGIFMKLTEHAEASKRTS